MCGHPLRADRRDQIQNGMLVGSYYCMPSREMSCDESVSAEGGDIKACSSLRQLYGTLAIRAPGSEVEVRMHELHPAVPA
jgi:hypothetical protein